MTESQNAPIIVAFVADLMFTTRIQNVVNHLGWRVEWVETAVAIGAPSSQSSMNCPVNPCMALRVNYLSKLPTGSPFYCCLT